jgi:tartrate dehydrogenase/decarboxylase / D-malate dehydrogenase
VKPFRIAVIPGDGIGKEVVPVAVDLLRAATVGEPRGLEFVDFPWGCDYYLASGRMMPDDALETLRAFDAIFLGAIGDPARVPDHVSLWGLLLAIRRGFHESLNLRPARYLEGLPSPLRDPKGLDVLVVRENSEGEYSRIGGLMGDGADEQAIQVSVFTRRAAERAMRYAFEAARGRRRHVTCATKSNAIEHTMPFWDRVFREVAADYPDVETRLIHIDALAARLVTAPASVDVIVASNLFGDILTDLSAALMGSIGVAPAANIDPDGGNPPNPPMFEPVHGSAPDIAGRGIANPIGQAWTGVLLLDHLGLAGPAERLMAAIEAAVAAGEVTPDLGGRLSTVEAGEAIGAGLGGTVRQSAPA